MLREPSGGQQDEERFRRGDQDVRRLLAHLLALPRGRVAGAHGGADGRERDALVRGQRGDLGQRRLQILVDVVAQRLERRDVDDLRSRRRARPARAARTRPSRQIRNAASVLPEPVGAEIRTSWPARISGQPRSCGSVGRGKAAREPFGDERIEAGKNICRSRGKNLNHLTISLTHFGSELRGTGTSMD